MKSGDRREIRRKSMLGTALFVLAIVAAVLFPITGSIWWAAAAVALLIPAIVMLYQAGSSIS